MVLRALIFLIALSFLTPQVSAQDLETSEIPRSSRIACTLGVLLNGGKKLVWGGRKRKVATITIGTTLVVLAGAATLFAPVPSREGYHMLILKIKANRNTQISDVERENLLELIDNAEPNPSYQTDREVLLSLIRSEAPGFEVLDEAPLSPEALGYYANRWNLEP